MSSVAIVSLSMAILGLLTLALVAVAWLESESESAAESGSWSSSRAGASNEESASTDKKHWLLGESDNVAGKKYLIGERTATIGRKPANFIQLADSNVSRVHCRVDGSPGRCRIEDLNSSHGTYINGDPLEPETPIPLRDRDSVRIGNTKFRYRRTAGFDTDDALTDRKRADERTSRRTAAPGEAKDVNAELLAAVREADGGIEEVAEEWGLEPDQIREQLFGDLEDE